MEAKNIETGGAGELTDMRIPRRIVQMAMGIAAVAVIASWRWPLVVDTPLMCYIAQRIRQGAVPYRDLFDMNFPGTYLVYMLVESLPFGIEASCHLANTLLVAVSVAGICSCMRSCGQASRRSAAAFFVISFFSYGPSQILQRELILTPLQVTAVALLLSHYAVRPSVLKTICAGVFFGAALTIKPFAVFVPAAIGILVLGMAPAGDKNFGRPIRDALCMAGGAAVPILLTVAWLFRINAWAGFKEIMFDYLLPIYSSTGRAVGESRVSAIARFLRETIQAYPFTIIACAGAGALFVLWNRSRNPEYVRSRILGAAFVGAAAHFVLQQKGFPYHLVPLAAFGGMLVLWSFDAALRSPIAATRPAAWAIWVCLFGPPTVTLLSRLVSTNGGPAPAAQKRMVDEMVAELQPRLRPSDTIQVLDTAQGAIYVLYRLEVAQPTRFIYDFPLLAHDSRIPYIQKLRHEALDQLKGNPPAYFLIMENGWGTTGEYQRVELFPELHAWLSAHYRIRKNGDGYRILERLESDVERS